MVGHQWTRIGKEKEWVGGKLAESPLPCDHKIQIKNGACAHVIKWRYGFHDNSRAG